MYTRPADRPDDGFGKWFNSRRRGALCTAGALLVSFIYCEKRMSAGEAAGELGGGCVPASIVDFPGDVFPCLGETIVLQVVVSGEQPISYEWRRNKVTIPDATGPMLTIDSVGYSDIGEYDVLVSNACGQDQSGVLALQLQSEEGWLEKTPPPGPHRFHSMVYDTGRQRVVCFGGSDDEGPHRETWEWDGSAWRLASMFGPSARTSAAMAFDSLRGVTVLFGGSASGQSGETWEWDGVQWRLRSTQGPPPRSRHAMAFDAQRGVTVLFGGIGGTIYDDTWEWNGVSWRPITDAGPPARFRHAMAFDDVTGAIVMFGGESFGGFILNDTWVLSGESWQRRTIPGPTARALHAMAYDPVRHVVMLYGGSSSGNTRSDTWEYKQGEWVQRLPTGPRALDGHGLAYDAARQRMVMLGGGNGTEYLAETWLFDDETWSNAGLQSPRPRSGHAMVFDENRGVAVLHGGRMSSGVSPETWEYDGSAWTLRTSLGLPSRRGHAMAYDSARGVCVQFGGMNFLDQINGETWEWNGTTWTLAATTGPSPRTDHRMVYDSARKVTVLFGGNDPNVPFSNRNDTWEWNGLTWTQRSFAGTVPAGRTLFGMAYDAGRGRTVLYGGIATQIYYGDTWEYDGNGWTLVTLAGPGVRRSQSMAYDPTHGLILMFGGGGTQATDSFWTWDGTMWQQRFVDGPAAVFDGAMTYDTARDSAVHFGGLGSFALSGRTWDFGFRGTTFIEQPASRLVCAGRNVSFVVQADGLAPLTYQWRKNGEPIAGATQQVLQVMATTVDDAGMYDAVVTNACGTPALTQSATLTVFETASGDGNVDGVADGLDVSPFISAMLMGARPSAWYCALDFDADGDVSVSDIEPFIEALLVSNSAVP